jgi:hypothetical protein
MRIKVLLIFLTIFCLTAADVKAQGLRGYYISPPFQNVKIDGGMKQVVTEIEIGNDTQDGQTFDLSVMDFGTLDEAGGVAFLATGKSDYEKKYSLASWISLEKNRVEVAPGGREKIKITILNKESLSPGGHYGAVLLTVKGAEGQKAQVTLVQSYATLFYVQKTGGEKPSLKFMGTEIKKIWWDLHQKVKLRFENNGNVHLIPRGKVVVKDLHGEEVSRSIINGESGLILPESFRQYQVETRPLGGWRWPGKYTFEVDYRYDGKDSFSTVNKDIFYFGREGVILASILALGSFGVMWFVVRKHRQ